jgi:hypothetical protein
VSAPLVPVVRGEALMALAGKAEHAAREIGRLRLRIDSDPQLGRFRFVADRIALDVEDMIAILTPSAAELAAWSFPGDDEAVDAAIEARWARADQVRRLLGDRRPW